MSDAQSSLACEMGKAKRSCGARRGRAFRDCAPGTVVIGGLHRDDFEWASREYETDGYVLVAFELDCDGYHWRAVYSPCRGRCQ